MKTKTTLQLNDLIFRQAKAQALREKISLTLMIEKAVRQYLRPLLKKKNGFVLRLKTRKSELASGVDLEDRNSLYERMEN
jgi:hypothetical protein